MKHARIFFLMLILAGLASCAETHKEDTTTHDVDTMVIKDNTTDNPTNAVTTDTTRR